MNYIQVGDIKVHYNLQGEGFPIVLIMGFTGSMHWWDPELINSLSEKYTVLTFDNRGAGRTVTPDEGDFSIEMLADDTAALMDGLGIERAHIFGFSMGGTIAQTMALRHSGKIGKLILGGTFCGGKETVMADPEVTKLLLDSSGGINGLFSRTLKLMFPAEFLNANPDFAADFKTRYMTAPISSNNVRRQMIASMKFSAYHKLPEIKLPALIVTGSEDILIPPANSHILAERIPGAKLIKYPGAGHCFMSPAREEFLKDMIAFLNS
jgi:pimeloyl-ACP methyl ester carboxylesterase